MPGADTLPSNPANLILMASSSWQPGWHNAIYGIIWNIHAGVNNIAKSVVPSQTPCQMVKGVHGYLGLDQARKVPGKALWSFGHSVKTILSPTDQHADPETKNPRNTTVNPVVRLAKTSLLLLCLCCCRPSCWSKQLCVGSFITSPFHSLLD